MGTVCVLPSSVRNVSVDPVIEIRLPATSACAAPAAPVTPVLNGLPVVVKPAGAVGAGVAAPAALATGGWPTERAAAIAEFPAPPPKPPPPPLCWGGLYSAKRC